MLTICCHFLGDVEEIEIQQKPALKVFKNITVIQEPGMVVLEVGIGEGERSILFSNNAIEMPCRIQYFKEFSVVWQVEQRPEQSSPWAVVLCGCVLLYLSSASWGFLALSHEYNGRFDALFFIWQIIIGNNIKWCSFLPQRVVVINYL